MKTCLLRLKDKFKIQNEFETNWVQLLYSAFWRLEKRIAPIITMLVISFLFAALGGFLFELQVKVELYEALLSLLAQVYASLMGFAIAGYAIFAALGGSDYTQALMHKKSSYNFKIPLFKVHLLVLIKFLVVVGISLIWFLVCYFLVLFQKQEIYLFTPNNFQWVSAGVILGLITGFLIAISFLETTAFIFNVYSMSLTQAFYYFHKTNTLPDKN
jgi:hypothetical protein